ncbi:MAG: CRISPR-associated ring nuclease, partial [Verrucomicrobiales bacterium]
MATLLMSLGTSPAVVPEAVLWDGVEFRAVHVLTTASVQQSDLDWIADWFRRRVPGVALSFTRVADFSDFRSEADHFLFEEVMYRWWLEMAVGERPWVCLAGGFKTMSAAMQKAAAVLGAAEVFHVLAESVYDGGEGKLRPPATEEEIDDSLAHGHLHWIRLGPESGWPQLRHVSPEPYPLAVEKQDGLTRWVTVVDQAFRDRLRQVVERSHNVAGAWDRLGNLPFPVLATWPAEQLAWLDAPVDPATDGDWL